MFFNNKVTESKENTKLLKKIRKYIKGFIIFITKFMILFEWKSERKITLIYMICTEDNHESI